ncbi:MAG: prepilin-type N-terminal cleavage/methylation domain-containing protein [Puniceicoccales bacterium]|nr:prepilin-type N-terminal cleavage/methylation domain-containing protein [Puniceicoccales bacterium]
MPTQGNLRRKKGFTLVEVLLALGVLSMAILSLAGLLGIVFEQVDDVVQINRALGVVTSVQGALDSPVQIGGEKLAGATDPDKPAFDVAYDFVKSAVSGQKVILYYFSAAIKNADGTERVLTMVYRAPGGNFDKAIYDTQNGTGPVFRVELSVAKALEGLRIEVDTATYRQKDTLYSGGPLPGSADAYALAFLPLYAEVYLHDFSDVISSQNRAARPIVGHTIALLRIR